MIDRPFPTAIAALFASCALFAGCSSAIDGGIAEPSVEPGETVLQFGPAGVGGIGVGTAFSGPAIEAALPGFAASSVTMATEDRTLQALAVFRDGLQVLQVVPGPDGTVGAVHGVSAAVRGPSGTRVGMSFADARIDPRTCRPGTGNWAGMPICPVPAVPEVTLVFAVNGAEDPTALPDAATLSGATLQRIIWTAGVGSAS
jgi:hypothetical protein